MKKTLSMQIFAYGILCFSIMYANTSAETESNSQKSATDIHEFNEKAKVVKKEELSTNESNNNFHEIMSTKSACAASCCSADNSVKRSDFSNKKEKKQERKKLFGWFLKSE
tara:strand:+ start:60 stop:392 length:333 start_codon:yes stop_codon:yes gene_type:complete